MTIRQMSSKVAAIRHLAFEDLGLFGPLLEARGLSIRYYDAGLDDLAEPIGSADLVIVLGGPIGVYETEYYPFLLEEREILRRRLEERRPTLGICLGAQLIAAELGARVYPGDTKEIGWGAIELTAEGHGSYLEALHGTPVLHWHGDTFDLPDSARLLAGTESYPHQAFALGHNILGLQFHAEIDPDRIEQWLIGHTLELRGAAIGPSMLRKETLEVRDTLYDVAPRLLNGWLEQLEW
jgi:GMP synthase (glutamine-hydrolysing)